MTATSISLLFPSFRQIHPTSRLNKVSTTPPNYSASPFLFSYVDKEVHLLHEDESANDSEDDKMVDDLSGDGGDL
jgi:hypothetical protein